MCVWMYVYDVGQAKSGEIRNLLKWMLKLVKYVLVLNKKNSQRTWW